MVVSIVQKLSPKTGLDTDDYEDKFYPIFNTQNWGIFYTVLSTFLTHFYYL